MPNKNIKLRNDLFEGVQSFFIYPELSVTGRSNSCSISIKKSLYTGTKKAIDGLLDFFPVSAMVFKHHLVDGQTAIDLKIKNGFGLFIG